MPLSRKSDECQPLDMGKTNARGCGVMKLSICPGCRVIHEAVGTKVLAGVDEDRRYELTHCRLCELPSEAFRPLPDPPDPADDEIGYPMAVVPWMKDEGPHRIDKQATPITSSTSTGPRRPAVKAAQGQPTTKLDIRVHGRRWAANEMSRHDDLPGMIEMAGGKLCINTKQRMLLLGALLEHVGTAGAVSLGPLSAWQAAIEQRRKKDGQST